MNSPHIFSPPLNDESAQCARALSLLKEARFQFRHPDDAEYLAELLAQNFPNSSAARRGLHELMLNAVEHGNLGITYAEKARMMNNGTWFDEVSCRLNMPENMEKYATITYQNTNGKITIIIEDMGVGFDWEHYMNVDARDVVGFNGRGIPVSRVGCFDSVDYIAPGNKVVCTKRLE